VILALPTPILPDETGGELQLRLAEIGAEGIVEALALLELGGAAETQQRHEDATYAKKIERADAQVSWSASATTVERLIRAYDPKPGAWTLRAGLEIRLFGARAVSGHSGPPGAVLAADGDAVVVACGDGAVRVLDVHCAGRKRQRAGEWLRGRGAAVGDVLGARAAP
jgi:methionyl-tRNA formyltransferase